MIETSIEREENADKLFEMIDRPKTLCFEIISLKATGK